MHPPVIDPAPPVASSDLHDRLRRSRWLVVTLGLLSACSPMAIDMYLPAFPQIASDLGTSMGLVQRTLSLYLLGLAMGQVLYGTMSDHLGRRGPLLVGCLAYTVAGVVCVFAQSIGSLLVARFLMGLGGAAGVVISRAIVRDLFDQAHSARYYSVMMIIGGMGPIVAPFLGGLLLTYFTWRTVFWVVAGFGLACTAAVWVWAPETLPRGHRLHGNLQAVARRYARLIANRRFIVPATAFMMGFGVLFTYITGSSFVFQQVYGTSPQVYSYFFAANGIAIYGGGQLNRLLLRRHSVQALLTAGCCLNLLLTATLLAVTASGVGGFWMFALVLLLCIASLSLIFPNATAAAMAPFAAEAGTASALLGMLQYGLGAVAGMLLGLIHFHSALPMAGIVLACSAAGCVVYVLGQRREQAASDSLAR